MTVVWLMAEWLVPTNGNWAIIENHYVALFMIIVLLLLLTIDAVNRAMDALEYQKLSPEEQAKVDNQSSEAWISSLSGAKPIEEEGEIMLTHDYDGIKELDNNLPPWWLYLFYATILFAGIYMVRFFIMDGPSSDQEYQMEMAAAQEEIDAWRATQTDLITEESVVILDGASDLAAGKEIFTVNCVACHLADGGGSIGPNLTDEYWILGGGIKNVFRTLNQGGRAGKGMVSWKGILNPLEMQQVASYVLSMQGTTPANPKAPEGDVWEEVLSAEE